MVPRPITGWCCRDGMLHLLDPGDGNPLHQLIGMLHSLAEERRGSVLAYCCPRSGSDSTHGRPIKEAARRIDCGTGDSQFYRYAARRAIRGGPGGYRCPSRATGQNRRQSLVSNRAWHNGSSSQIDPDGSRAGPGIRCTAPADRPRLFPPHRKTRCTSASDGNMERNASAQHSWDYLQQLQTHRTKPMPC